MLAYESPRCGDSRGVRQKHFRLKRGPPVIHHASVASVLDQPEWLTLCCLTMLGLAMKCFARYTPFISLP